MLDRVGVYAVAAALLGAGGAADADTIRSRVPQAQFDAVMGTCVKDAPRATCACFVRKLNETADGQVTMDVMGQNILTPKPPEAELLKLINRHGMRGTEVQAAVARVKPRIEAMFKDCA